MDAIEVRAAGQIRRRAVIKMAVSAALIPPAIWLTFALSKLHVRWIAALPALLLVPMLMAVVELASGLPFAEAAARWDALEGWQRGVIGTAIVVGVFLALMSAIVLAAKLGLL